MHILANCKLENHSQLLVDTFAQSLKLYKFAFQALWPSGYSVGQALKGPTFKCALSYGSSLVDFGLLVFFLHHLLLIVFVVEKNNVILC